jgi:hypothetical protein
MQNFLINLCIVLLEKLLVKGTKAFDQYIALKKELEENDKKVQEYNKVLKNPKSSRAERRHAEDDALY